ncbi:MAG: catalase family peroxidase [Polyangiaceae bacterium]
MNSASSEVAQHSARETLSRVELLFRLACIGLVVLGTASLFAYAAGWLTPRALTPARMIDAFERANGQHTGFRRNHAKGLAVSGHFESNGRGVALSKAAVFQPGIVPVIGRFAIAGGQPFANDTATSVRSLALLFTLPDGEQWRTGMNDIPVFAVNTPRAFYEQLVASAPDPATGRPNPARMSDFLARNPASARAIQLIRARPKTSGFETSTFNSLNAFRFMNAAGEVAAVRWSVVATASKSTATVPSAGENYLFDALIAAIQHAPLTWHLIVVVAGATDPTNDATVAWPTDRQRIDVGTLTLDHAESEETSRARDINFDPLVLPDGMAASDDPLLSARSAAYSESFTRRAGERKEQSAISNAEVRK